MDEALIALLETFKYPVYRQGSLSDTDNYPDSFFTFWNNGSPDHSHYDNTDYGTEWEFDVNFYSNEPNLTYSVLQEAITLLKENGWVIPEKGHDVMSDEPTHTGRGITALFLEV